ncbi:MAG: hypothetical protein LBF51_04195 [Zoogloeaceae bacterium]|nr:hypothetical protein [Zoogloeaceae bacterium]
MDTTTTFADSTSALRDGIAPIEAIRCAPAPCRAPAPPEPLPIEAIERLFNRMTCFYGSKFLDLWKNADMNQVMAEWAKALGEYRGKPHCLQAGMERMKSRPFPPTLPEFLADCRSGERQFPEFKPLPPPPAPETRERNRKMFDEFAASLSTKTAHDHLAWAKHPKTPFAARLLFNGAKRSARMAAILDEHIRAGVISETGILLRKRACLDDRQACPSGRQAP